MAKTLNTSASQFKTATSCMRKWWLEKVVKLPVSYSENFTFGNVFHACAERVCKGQDPFPMGWNTDPENQQTTDADESAIIRSQIQLGIDEGVFRPRPGASIELWMGDTPTGWSRGPTMQMGIIPGVIATGKKDVEDPVEGVIEDHKTTSGFRYSLSSEGLSKDEQMILYAKEYFDKYPDRQTVKLQQNQFLKREPGLRVVAQEMSRDEVEQAFRKIIQLARSMKQVQETFGTKTDQWDKVPGPVVGSRACHAYNRPCDFLAICQRKITPEQLRAQGSKEPPVFREDHKTMVDMSALFPGSSPTAPSSVPAGQPPLVNGQDPGPAVKQTLPPAPWADPQCAACDGNGWATNGQGCRPCVTKFQMKGAQTPHPAPNPVPAPDPVPAPQPQPQHQTPVQIPPSTPTLTPSAQQQPVGVPSQTPRQQPAPQATPQEDPNDADMHQQWEDSCEEIIKGKPGRPASTFTLLRGCIPMKGTRGAMMIEDLWGRVMDYIAEQEKQPSYYHLDARRRQDLVGRLVPSLVPHLKGKTVVCTNKVYVKDIEVLVQGLAAYATSGAVGG